MRIAEIIPYKLHPYSGVMVAAVRLATEFAARGHHVELWKLHEWIPGETEQFSAELAGAGVETVQVSSGSSPWRLDSGAQATIAARQVDVAHLHSVFSPLNNLLSRHLRVPFVISPHGGYASPVLRRHRFRKLAFKYLLELPMLRRAAMVFALSPAESRQLRQFGYGGPVAVIPNGISGPELTAGAGEFRAELGLEPGASLAVFVGRLDLYYKRLEDVVRGVAATPNWNLALVGPDWQGSRLRLQRLIAELGCRDRVWLLEPRRGNSLHAVLAAATVFVLLSRSEGMPMALLEALYQGVPAVVSREVEQSIPVGTEGAGWVTDPAGLSELLIRLGGTGPDVWTRVRGAAARYGAAFSWPDIAGRYERSLTQALEGELRKPAGAPGATRRA